jgi:hypothetical protein
MIRIDEFFEKYPENIIGFRVNKTTKIIDFWLNNDWEFLKPVDGISIKKQKANENNTASYYIIYSDVLDFNSLYMALTDIIEHNLDVERKQALFKDKLTQLKTLFTTLSYDELKEIQFETPYSLRQQDGQPDFIEPNQNIIGGEDEVTENIEESKTE